MKTLGLALNRYANDFRSTIPQADNGSYPNEAGTGIVSRTWDDFYVGDFVIAKYLPDRRGLSCPTRDSIREGTYGMLKVHSSDPAYIRNKVTINPPNPSCEFFGIKLSKIRNSSDYLLIGDTSANTASPVAANRPPDIGTYIWESDRYSSSSNENRRGLWASHFNKVNAVFADGHAEACDKARLLGSSNYNPRTPVIPPRKPGCGVTHWKNENFSENAY
jgi:prepilin-type processing-associated H-X9-DG protein